MGWQALTGAAALLQYQGALFAILLCIGWVWAGVMRMQEVRRQQRQRRGKPAATTFALLVNTQPSFLVLLMELACRAILPSGSTRRATAEAMQWPCSGRRHGPLARCLCHSPCQRVPEAQLEELAVTAGHAV